MRTKEIAIIWGAGFLIGFFLLLPHNMRVPMIWGFVAIETAHALAPITLGWTHFRQEILERPEWWIGLPAVLIVLAFALPFWLVLAAFTAANAWHFGMQNFGVLRLLGVRRWRWELMAACLAASGFITYALWRIAPRDVVLLVVAMHSVNHWVTDLGLTGMVVRYWPLALVALLALGCVGYSWNQLTPYGAHKVGEIGIRAAYALGFVHFLYSRWVWQRGRELLAA